VRAFRIVPNSKLARARSCAKILLNILETNLLFKRFVCFYFDLIFILVSKVHISIYMRARLSYFVSKNQELKSDHIF
jgi:hypothetical protein